ncbi:oxalurate catabolism protein HpxZ [Cryptosporangium phraense]|uniref:Oxalurate catabolism protein HpxZ n=1 Tax=Cryptosporangium phraense TaxID=2593070 RepID=A0A545AY81_9ACTN|nr:oxalurate catabolism protein HpxZ [Cryptosporangium phraense]TQS46302.1 oxalurate catabolism protein HpxZ [Cryptosporangium phraense]
MEVDRPEIVAEVRAAFSSYEDALQRDDRATILGWFWDAPETVRFGIADRQNGVEELRAWRAAQPPVPLGRTLTETRVTTFGADYAVVTTLFTYPSGEALGRQSQTWARFGVGWRIVSAHVSEIRLPSWLS